MSEHRASVITWSCHSVWLAAWHITGRLTCLAVSLVRRHGRQYFFVIPSPCAVPKQYWREHCREACWDTQTSIRLASHLVRAPNSSSRGHEFESPMWRELSALTKSEKTLWVRLSTAHCIKSSVELENYYSTVGGISKGSVTISIHSILY